MIEKDLEDLKAWNPKFGIAATFFLLIAVHYAFASNYLNNNFLDFVNSFENELLQDAIFFTLILLIHLVPVIVCIVVFIVGLTLTKIILKKLKRLGNNRVLGGVGVAIAGAGVILDSIQTMAILL